MAATLKVDATAVNGTMAAASGSTSSLPASPSKIVEGIAGKQAKAASPAYVVPPIPQSFRESLQAYFRKSDSAASELHLYRHSGYFDGATLNNAPNADLFTAFHSIYSQRTEHGVNEADNATVGTRLAKDGKVGSIRMVDIGSPSSGGLASWIGWGGPSQRLINMLEIGTPRPMQEIRANEEEEKVVLLHGYGAGTGFFYQNIKALAQHPQSRLYCLDWLGMGRSSRPSFHISAKDAKTKETRVEAAETFFVQALEDWRSTMGLEKMTLVGHSLGGYLSVAYSLKYPQHVSRLVLLSPAGIPEAPPEERVKEPAERKDAGNVATEVQQSRKDVAPQTSAQERQDEQAVRAQAQSGASKSSRDSKSGEQKPASPVASRRRREIVQFLWERNLSPFAIVRNSFVWGPMLTAGYTRRRFAALPEEDLRTLNSYCYHIFSSRGSSEYALAHLLAPFAFARMPIVNRIAALPKTLPVTFIYGERGIDWMDERGGRESVKRLAAAGNPHGRTFAVPHSGHHVYLDNPHAFDSLLAKVLRGQVDEAGKAGKQG